MLSNNKTENIKRWLESGRKMTQHQAKTHFNCERLASVINRFRNRFNDKWIVDLGDPGKHSNYQMLQRGKYLHALVRSFRFKVEHCNYIRINGIIRGADILLTAENGLKKFKMMVNQDALRSKVVMERNLENALYKLKENE